MEFTSKIFHLFTGNKFFMSIIFGLLLFTIGQCQLFEGQQCTYRRSQKPGVCKILEQCTEAVENLDKDINPEICSFKGREPVVCCPYSATNPQGKPTTPPPTRVSGTNEGKSMQMCRTYAKLVFESRFISGSVVTAQNVDKCNFKVIPLVFGGEVAKEKEFPHMALIGYGTEPNVNWNCGGSLISNQWVMSAGHCIFDEEFGNAKYVRVGDHDITSDTDNAQPQNFEISQVVKHPEYKSARYNDIALFQLDRKVKFTEWVRPACLWTKPDFRTYTKAIATGWGNTRFFSDKSDKLRKVTLNLIDHNSCNQSFHADDSLTRGIDDKLQVCAGTGNSTERVDTCQGDSGGPLQVYTAPEIYCMYAIIGVTSFGKPCGITKSPGVYTRVSTYVPWIEKIVWGSN